jgi:hypothetical protein
MNIEKNSRRSKVDINIDEHTRKYDGNLLLSTTL